MTTASQKRDLELSATLTPLVHRIVGKNAVKFAAIFSKANEQALVELQTSSLPIVREYAKKRIYPQTRGMF